MKMHATNTKLPTGNHKEIDDKKKKYSVKQITNIRIQIYFFLNNRRQMQREDTSFACN